MPSQQIEALETINALKRKLKREKEASTVPLAQFATNRGNKLRTGARYVHAGSLPYKHGVNGYKERIEHAGYQRYILERNPVRFDEHGGEVDEEEDVDLPIEDENPYRDVKLEELLRPLVHPSEILQHSAVAQIYKDPALSNMVRATETQLREERKNLWNAKNLYRCFTGDESWIPCEKVEALSDWELFGPQPGQGSIQSRKRKLNGDGVPELNGVDQIDHVGEQSNGNDVEMVESEKQAEQSIEKSLVPQTNGIHEDGDGTETTTQINPAKLDQDKHGGEKEEDQEHKHNFQADGEAEVESDIGVAEEDQSPSSTPPAPLRRITRALAANNNPTSTAATPPRSSSPATPTVPLSPSTLQPHPLFLLPASLTLAHQPHPSTLPLSIAHSGLPPDEVLETRKLLGIYIQKSEETIRSLARILAKLTKATSRRDKLVEWCLAEAHVGELSDGEDWVDEERWGVQGELRKGRDEEENNGAGGNVGGSSIGVGGVGTGDGGDEATGAVAIGGRKGKRRRAVREQ